jgi:hypothetical protein
MLETLGILLFLYIIDFPYMVWHFVMWKIRIPFLLWRLEKLRLEKLRLEKLKQNALKNSEK